MTEEPKKPTITVRLKGEGITPDKISISQLNELVSAIQSLTHTELQLAKVRRGSAIYGLSSSSPLTADSNLQVSKNALTSPVENLRGVMLSPFDELRSLSKRLHCVISIKSAISGLNWVFNPTVWEEARERSLIEDETSVTGRLMRVGGVVEKKCGLKIGETAGLQICRLVNSDVAQKLGSHLYEMVTLRGRGVFLIQDWTMLDFKVESYSLRKPLLGKQVFHKLREVSGNAWDGIDVDEELRGLR